MKQQDRRSEPRQRTDTIPRGMVRCEHCGTQRPLGRRCPNDCRILPDK